VGLLHIWNLHREHQIIVIMSTHVLKLQIIVERNPEVFRPVPRSKNHQKACYNDKIANLGKNS
jgi:hypothetical protein